MNLPPPLIRYFIPILLGLLLLLQNGECERAKIAQNSLKTSSIKDQYMKQLDIYHHDLKCQLARFGYYQNFYKISIGDEVETYADLLDPSEIPCPRKSHTFIVASEGEQYYWLGLNDNGLNIFTYKISFAGVPKGIESQSDIHGLRVDGLVDLSTCYEDLGSIYCVATASTDPYNDDDDEAAAAITPIYKILRFTKRGQNHYEHSGTSKLVVKHGEKPRYILQDSQSGHIAIIYDTYGGHEDKSFDFRPLFELGGRGRLVRGQYPVHQTLGIASHNGYRFFIVYPKHKFGNDDKSPMSSYTYTFYRSPLKHPSAYPSANKEVAGTNWGELEDRNARRIKMFFKNSMPDHFELAKVAAQRCVKIFKKNAACKADTESMSGIRTAMIVVCALLLAIFILLIVLLLVYLLWCVKTKHRRHRKRKHRKHRKHRKQPRTETSTKNKDEEVEVEPGKPEEEEEKSEENKVVKKLKQLGGVDYSSSSSEDPEHSQAYFSLRDQFDTKVSTGHPPSSTPGGDTNKNEKLGTAVGGDGTSAVDQATGATPEEHEMQDKYGAKPEGPRSVYMKPKKKKK